MPKRREFTLSSEDLKVVEDTIARDKHPEVVKRAMALRFLHLGHSTEEVAEMLLVAVSTIYTWWRRWEVEGVAGLANKPKSGRPSKATEEYCQKLDEALEQEPCAGQIAHPFGKQRHCGRNRPVCFLCNLPP